jgi:hypothetical protein
MVVNHQNPTTAKSGENTMVISRFTALFPLTQYLLKLKRHQGMNRNVYCGTVLIGLRGINLIAIHPYIVRETPSEMLIIHCIVFPTA